mgnify:FL=1
MGKGLAIFLALILVIAIVGFSVVGAVIGFNNTAVKMENGVKAQYDQNKNNYDNYFKKLKEVVQVPEMYIEDMKKLWDGVMTGRYGKEGSKAMFQWIQERNPKVDASLYNKVQDVIEGGRNSFEADQKMLIDKKREYENLLGVFPNSFLAGFLGFPKINLADYAIVTSGETEEIFKTKKSEPIKLR